MCVYESANTPPTSMYTHVYSCIPIRPDRVRERGTHTPRLERGRERGRGRERERERKREREGGRKRERERSREREREREREKERAVVIE